MVLSERNEKPKKMCSCIISFKRSWRKKENGILLIRTSESFFLFHESFNLRSFSVVFTPSAERSIPAPICEFISGNCVKWNISRCLSLTIHCTLAQNCFAFVFWFLEMRGELNTKAIHLIVCNLLRIYLIWSGVIHTCTHLAALSNGVTRMQLFDSLAQLSPRQQTHFINESPCFPICRHKAGIYLKRTHLSS